MITLTDQLAGLGFTSEIGPTRREWLMQITNNCPLQFNEQQDLPRVLLVSAAKLSESCDRHRTLARHEGLQSFAAA